MKTISQDIIYQRFEEISSELFDFLSSEGITDLIDRISKKYKLTEDQGIYFSKLIAFYCLKLITNQEFVDGIGEIVDKKYFDSFMKDLEEKIWAPYDILLNKEGIFYKQLSKLKPRPIVKDLTPPEEKKEETIIGEGAGFLHVFIPILTLILCAIGGLLYSGYKKFNTLKNSEINIINLLGDAPTIHILIFSTLMSLLICIILLKKDRIMPGGTMRKSFLTGLKHMVSASLLIMLPKGLSQISGDLGTGLYITGI